MLRTVPLPAVLAAFAACVAPTPEPVRRDDLLATVDFYRTHNIGAKTRPTGLLRFAGGGFEPLAWPEVITNGVAVDESGEWLYLACGNGVLTSRDGGQSWFLTGGIEMAEVQAVWIDTRDPRRAWATGAYGLFRCANILHDSPWERLEFDDTFRYCSDVFQDSRDPKVLWVGSEEGIVRVRRGVAERRGPDVRVRSVTQDPYAPERFWATSDGLGVLRSEDGGETWAPVPGTPAVSLTVERPAGTSRTVLVGGIEGVWRSDDLGASWTLGREGLPEQAFVFSIAVDPADARHVCLASCDGVFESADGGATWRRIGLEGALCSEVRFARRTLGPPQGPPEGVERPRIHRGPPRAEHRPDDPAFEERRAHLLERFRAKLPGPEAERLGLLPGILASREPEPDPRLEELLLAELEEPAHSMFFSLPGMGLYLHGRDTLPIEVVQRLETLLTEYSIYRGDTENHWVMHYTAMLLAAQTWPDLPADRWYMGRSSASLYREAREWLRHWARLTATKGQGEYDSPHYMVCFITPMLLLYDFAEEPEMKQLAGMMLDLLLADYLSESLQGAYCGGHSRAPSGVALETTNNRATAYHFLYAGGVELPENPHGWMLLAALSDYVPPSELDRIANWRVSPFTTHEMKRVRNVIRLGTELNPPVYKTNRFTPAYCLGSTQGGVLQPIQQHTWDVTWLGGAPNSTLFTVHPSYAGTELAMFFPEEIHFLTTSVAGQKSTYTSPDKWISASPWERVFQHDDVVLALYQVPEGWTYEHVDLHWPHCLAREEEDGWRFGRDGRFAVAVHATGEGTWIEGEGADRLRFDGGRLGFVIVTADLMASGGETELYRLFQSLCTATEPVLEGSGDGLTLRFVNFRGQELECRFGDELGRVGGEPAPFPRDALFQGNFVHSRRGSGVIELTDWRTTRILDFNRFEIRTEPR